MCLYNIYVQKIPTITILKNKRVVVGICTFVQKIPTITILKNAIILKLNIELVQKIPTITILKNSALAVESKIKFKKYQQLQSSRI